MSALPPGPRFAALQTYRYVTDPFRYLADLRARYGDVATLPVLNGRVVMGFVPEAAKQVFTADPDFYDPFAVAALAPLIGDGSLLVTSGERHKKDRKLLTPPFHGARMRAYGEAMREVTRARTAAWSTGAELRLLDTTTAISLDVILRALFGVREGELMREARETIREALSGFSPALIFSRHFQTPLFPPYRRYMAAQRRYRALITRLLAERRSAPSDGEDILAMLLAARYDDGSAMSDAEIESHLLTLVVAGHETTSITLAWAVHELLRAPEALARVRDEVSALGADPDPEALAKLPYLDAVVKETLRRRTIVTDSIRLLRKPMSFMGYEVPAGFALSVASAAIHMDPALYPEPERFRPERFLERKYGPFEHLAFGGGHRRCIGAAFSDYETKVVLATLVSEWELALASSQPEVAIRRNVTMGPRHGVRVRVVSRRAIAGDP